MRVTVIVGAPDTRADDETALQIATGDQLFDEQSRHDRLAGAGIVGKQEAQWLPRQHGLIDRRDLVWQRINNRGMDSEHRVEEVRKADAMCFGDQAEQGAVAVKTPGAALLHEIETWLVVSIEKLVCHPAGGRLVGKFEGLGTKPLHADDRDEAVRKDTTYRSIGLKVFKSHHSGPWMATLDRLFSGRRAAKRLMT